MPWPAGLDGGSSAGAPLVAPAGGWLAGTGPSVVTNAHLPGGDGRPPSSSRSATAPRAPREPPSPTGGGAPDPSDTRTASLRPPRSVRHHALFGPQAFSYRWHRAVRT